MKKCWIVLLLVVLLTGCDARQTFETMLDDCNLPVMAQVQQVQLSLPENAAVPSMENGEGGKIYLCDGYTVTLQTMDAGDLDGTLRQITGFGREQLTVMQTTTDDIDRYQCVWSAAGEGGDHVGRAVILDDGSYHYAVTVMADFASAGELASVWQGILDSAQLVSTD